MASDKYEPLIFHQVDVVTLQTQLTNILCSILFIFGVIGNILGLFIFSLSRRTWRISSIYARLATCNSITNLLCVIRYVCILHLTPRFIIRQFVGQTWWACKFYEFTFSFRIISSWITLFWMFERLICVSARLRSFCHRWNSCKLSLILPIIIIIPILIGVVGPPVYFYQPKIIFNNSTINSSISMIKRTCGLTPDASTKWQKYFYEIHFGINHFTIRCLFSEVIPGAAIVLFNSYIIYHLIRIRSRLSGMNGDELCKKQSQTASWMNVVLILHSSLFLLSIVCHIIGHFVSINTHETCWVLLAVLINCSLNFYVYCLSGKAFRHEIRRFIYRFKMQITYNMQTCHSQRRRSTNKHSFTYEMNNFGYILQHRNTSVVHVV